MSKEIKSREEHLKILREKSRRATSEFDRLYIVGSRSRKDFKEIEQDD